MTRRDGVLVLGFGPFGSYATNPATLLALAVDGAKVGRGVPVWGRQMPVSYRRCVEVTAAAIAELRPRVVLGVGVAPRAAPMFERKGRALFGEKVDIDGRYPDWRVQETQVRFSTLPIDRMAHATGWQVSDDCGQYVCNGWLFATLGMAPPSVLLGFLHVPERGANPTLALRALEVATDGVAGSEWVRTS